jgi:hypothetical protein
MHIGFLYKAHICLLVSNNLTECWNAGINKYKDLPIYCMADAVREKVLTLFAKRRKISNALSPNIFLLWYISRM